MKKLNCIFSLVLVIAMVLSLSVTALAADAPTIGTTTSGKNENIIPVTVSAEPTVLDVTLPTAFPTVVDPESGETTEGEAPVITNNSYGSIVVSNITVKDNATESVAATWHLAAYDKNMSEVKVDSNLIGIAITPKKGTEGATDGTVLKTTDDNAVSQVLLSERSEDWTMNGNTATDGSNKISVKYDTIVSAVSTRITNVTAANIVITIAWNTQVA